MIWPLDGLTLALTKLRTHKVRTGFTVAIAAILFGLATAVIMTTDGVFDSYDRMMRASMTGRYIIGGTQAFEDTSSLHTDPEVINAAQSDYNQLVADKKAEAKRLGIEYDVSADPSPVETIDGRKQLSYASAVAQKVIDKAQAEKFPARTFDDFKKYTTDYRPSALYEVKSVSPGAASLAEMKNGKEDFAGAEAKPQSEQAYSGSMPSDLSSQSIVTRQLLTNYLIDGYVWKPANGTVPVVVTQKRAATLTGYVTPKKEAPAKERLEYNRTLRSRANGKTFSVCYRNQASVERIQQAIAIAKEIADHKNDKNYQKPSLIYGLPDASSCGPAIVVSDTRSGEEKQLAAKRIAFDRKFNNYQDAMERKITYEVVGVAPNTWAEMDGAYSSDITDMFTSMLMSQSFRFAIPSELYAQLPNKADLAMLYDAKSDTTMGQVMFSNTQTYFAEFANAKDAKEFAKRESCQYGMSPNCLPKTKYFLLSPFGSNSIAIDEGRQAVSKVVLWMIGIIGVIAAIIASLTIGRTIADGRRETAVFRAIGFKRMDISQVYVTYTLLLCIDITIFAILLGMLVAFLINNWLWLDATVKAQLALGVNDPSIHFGFLGIGSRLLWVVGAIFAVGLVGMSLPLLRNIRRNPIRDMRDE